MGFYWIQSDYNLCHQYNVNTAQQDNAGHIPKPLWKQFPHT